MHKYADFHVPRVTFQDLPSRPRRNRRSDTVRKAFSETFLSPSNFIMPVFVHDGEKNIPIDSMPGVYRLGWQHGLIDAVAEARSYGVNQVVIFPKVRVEDVHFKMFKQGLVVEDLRMGSLAYHGFGRLHRGLSFNVCAAVSADARAPEDVHGRGGVQSQRPGTADDPVAQGHVSRH